MFDIQCAEQSAEGAHSVTPEVKQTHMYETADTVETCRSQKLRMNFERGTFVQILQSFSEEGDTVVFPAGIYMCSMFETELEEVDRHYST